MDGSRKEKLVVFLFIYFFISTPVISLSQNRTSNITVIEAAPRKFIIEHHDYYGSVNTPNSFGKYHTVPFVLGGPTLFYSQKYPFVIWPGEDVTVTIAGSSQNVEVKGNSQRKADNDLLKLFVQRYGPFSQSIDEKSKARRLDLTSEKERLREQLEIVDNFNKKNPLTPAFILFVKCFLTFESLAARIADRSRSALLPAELERDIQAALSTYTAKELLYVDSYRRFLYLLTRLRSPAGKTSVDYLQTAVTSFHGAARDYQVYLEARAAFYNNTDSSPLIISIVNQYCKDSTLRGIISSEFAGWNGPDGKEKTDTLVASSGERVAFGELIKSHRGKLVFIDFWASWCLPCRNQMPHLASIEKSMKDKDISFMTIFIDKDSSAWLKSMTKLPAALFDKNAYLMDDIGNSFLLKKYKIRGIPRYMLIGRDGKLKMALTPMPDSGILKDLLEQQLNIKN